MQGAHSGFSSVRRTQATLCALAFVLVFASGLCVAASELGFTTTVTPNLVARMVERFSELARQRIGAWVDFAGLQQAIRTKSPQPASENARLQSVNAYINTVPWYEDQKHWGQVDYWATPAETIASHGGDCEDFAIAKYFLLKELGVPIERLRITYVRSGKINLPHMVLAYYATPGGEPLILDNLDHQVRPASQRTDLVPVYSFNDDDVVMVQGNQKSSSLQIRAWQGVIERLEREARL
jgi:predicted transglutaminase-like cysteine proteinase